MAISVNTLGFCGFSLVCAIGSPLILSVICERSPIRLFDIVYRRERVALRNLHLSGIGIDRFCEPCVHRISMVGDAVNLCNGKEIVSAPAGAVKKKKDRNISAIFFAIGMSDSIRASSGKGFFRHQNVTQHLYVAAVNEFDDFRIGEHIHDKFGAA